MNRQNSGDKFEHTDEAVLKYTIHKMQRALSSNPVLGGSWYKLFQKFDVDGSGKIEFSELLQVLRAEVKVLKTKVSDAELRVVWSAFDKDGDGSITVKEFCGLMRTYGDVAATAPRGHPLALTHADSGIPSLRAKKAAAHKPTLKPWGAGPFRKSNALAPPVPKSRHEREADQIAESFASNVHGDFMARTAIDNCNRSKLVQSLQVQETAKQHRAQVAATTVNPRSKRILKATGRGGVNGGDWIESLHNSRVNHMTRFLMVSKDSRDGGGHNPVMWTDSGER